MNRHKVTALAIGFICVCKSLPKIGELLTNILIEHSHINVLLMIVLSLSNNMQQTTSIFGKVLMALVNSSEITLS